ncbi:MAG: agglutinin biogenesis protein MshI [Burkholderiales bacterium RIFCSPLOWO2_02_FULL_57_36]|nr:MAG: agglutinin biogenesis protein MshI [Burkholderiales bacterium RIFCSPLOWO2_02_FULL_57_36]
MALFAKNRKIAGRMVVHFQEDGICVAFMRRLSSGSAVVNRVIFYPHNKSTAMLSLSKLAKDLHGAQYDCSNLLTTGEYQLLSVDAPNVPVEEMKTAMRWRLKDMLDYHIDDATIDVLAVPGDKDAPVRNHSMYAVAARNQLIEQRQAQFDEARIPLSVIDIPEMAQRNLSAMLEPAGRGVALLSFDASGGLLTVTFSGELYLARRIDVTLQQIQQAESEQKDACYDQITLELQRSFDHFDRQYRFITLSKLVLSPLGEVGKGLQTYLAANLYVPIEIMDLSSLFDISNVPDLKRLETQQRYFLALGAALREEEIAL